MGTPLGQKGRANKAADARTPEGEDDRKKILIREYGLEAAKLKKYDPKDPESADNVTKIQGNLDAMKREMKAAGIQDPDAEIAKATPKPASKPASGGHPADVMEILKRNGVIDAKP